MSEDEYENVPGDFAALEHVDWDVVLGDQPNAAAPRRSPAPTNSSQYFEDELDEGLLSQLDVLEASLTQPPQARDSPQGFRKDTTGLEDPRRTTASFTFYIDVFDYYTHSRSPEKDNNDDRLLQAFSSYEDAMTCPM
ncbi:hypothetical protein AX16_005663 [Volvariella volvacea WC 439]|nr:hypothetical protein AX16_005663 [Volvariella volvacea WC 439]